MKPLILQNDYGGCLLLLQKHGNQKQLREERVYFRYTSTSQPIIRGSQSENLEAGPDTEAMEDTLPGLLFIGKLGLFS